MVVPRLPNTAHTKGASSGSVLLLPPGISRLRATPCGLTERNLYRWPLSTMRSIRTSEMRATHQRNLPASSDIHTESLRLAATFQRGMTTDSCFVRRISESSNTRPTAIPRCPYDSLIPYDNDSPIPSSPSLSRVHPLLCS